MVRSGRFIFCQPPAPLELQGEQFVALNGWPGFPFTSAASLVVNCESQEEIDHYWDKLAADGGEQI